MEHILIVYSSRNGQTAKIARYMRRRLFDAGYGVQLENISSSSALTNPDLTVDAVIVGAPIYAQKYPKAMVKWVKSHRSYLSERKNAFFSVSLNAADKRPDSRVADRALLNKFRRATGWNPEAAVSFAGALSYSHYGFFLKRIMRRISALAGGPTNLEQDYELTDWSQVDAFLEAFTGERDIMARAPVASDGMSQPVRAPLNISASRP